MTPEKFRQYGHQLIDLIADYRQTVGERPVMAQVEPGYLKAALPDTAPRQGEPFEAILDDVNRLVMPGLSHWQHPDFYGCLLYTSPSPRDYAASRMPSSA